MAIIIKPPNIVTWGNQKSVFLAGTIDNGEGVNWQAQIEDSLNDLDILILNPRRDEWDSSWEQSIENTKFREQVEWELEGLEKCSQIFMYFAPGSKSPITLLELGLHSAGDKIIIVCPRGFWRRGNIEVVANKYNLPLFESTKEGLSLLKERLA